MSLFFEWSLWEFLRLHTTSMWPEWLCVPAGFVFSVALLVREGEWANGHLAVASRAFCLGGSKIKHGFITRGWMSETRRWSILCYDHKTYQLNEKMQPSLILKDGDQGVNSEGHGQFLEQRLLCLRQGGFAMGLSTYFYPSPKSRDPNKRRSLEWV